MARIANRLIAVSNKISFDLIGRLLNQCSILLKGGDLNSMIVKTRGLL